VREDGGDAQLGVEAVFAAADLPVPAQGVFPTRLFLGHLAKEVGRRLGPLAQLVEVFQITLGLFHVTELHGEHGQGVEDVRIVGGLGGEGLELRAGVLQPACVH